MGATTFIMTHHGTNVKETFKKLYEDAIYTYGNDPYNGTISTTSLGHEIALDEELQTAVDRENWDILEKHDRKLFSSKRQTNYSKTISHYNAFVPKWTNDKETVARKKGVRNLTQFVAIPESQLEDNLYWRPYQTLSEVKKIAKQRALDKGENVYIMQMRSNGEMFKLGLFKLETDGKKYNSARKSKGKVYLPVYKMNFYVYAAT